MIYDNIKNIEKYKDNKELYTVLSELSKIEIGKPDEKHLINTRVLSDAKFEAHRKNIDVHYVLDQYEIILITNKTEKLNIITEYNSENDMEFFELGDDYATIKLNAGDFLVVYPGEAHAPIITEDARTISKVCKKIKV